MRIDWFSPLLPARTDIAHYTARILPALASCAEVVLWTDQKDYDPGLRKYATVVTYAGPHDIRWGEFPADSICFYNIGNNLEFHKSILQASRLRPGIVILHDPRLHHMFAQLYRWVDGDRDGYIDLMRLQYGGVGAEDAALFWDDGLSIDSMVERYPLTGAVLENALGVVVHTAKAFEFVRRNAWCPAAWRSLPYPARSWPPRTARNRSGCRLIIFGYLNTNRRLESVLKALASLPERDHFHLDIYGQISNSGTIEKLIASLDLRRHVALKGFVAEEELDRALENADLAVNLRYPSVDEASGTQLRIWDHALPSLVTRTGWYASIAEGTVGFVGVETEIEDLQRHFRAFLADSQKYRDMGVRGRNLLAEEHAPEQYARHIERVAAAALKQNAPAAGRLTADRIADDACHWISSPAANTLAASAAAQIGAAFGSAALDLVPPETAGLDVPREDCDNRGSGKGVGSCHS